MGKESRARMLADHQAMAVGRNIRVSPQEAQSGGAADPRQEGGSRAQRIDLFPEAHRPRREEGAAIGRRQCREQSRSRRGRSGRARGFGRQKPGDEAFPRPRPRQFRRHREILQPDHHRGRGTARSREEGGPQGRRGRRSPGFGQEILGQEIFGQESARQEACRRKNPPGQRRKHNGSEGQSDRPASGHQPDLGLALVRGQEGVWQAPAGRHQDPRISQR